MKKKLIGKTVVLSLLLAPPVFHAQNSFANAQGQAQSTHSIQIHDIQGAGHFSPLKGQHVHNVEGIVTYQYQVKGNHYFHLQTPDKYKDKDPNTSEGIIVYAGHAAPSVKVGDLVQVSGMVDEYAIEGYDTKQQTDLPLTEIDARTSKNGNIMTLKHNQPLPEPIKIKKIPKTIASDQHFSVYNPKKCAIDYWESLEGMRVQIGNVRSVGPQSHGEVFTVLNRNRQETKNGGVLLKEDNQNGQRIAFKMNDSENRAHQFNVNTGDHFNGPLIGYVNYSFQNYKINIDSKDMEAAYRKGKAQQQGTYLKPSENKLTVASYNLENFSNDVKTSSQDKAQKLAKGIVTDMKKPDIIGVTEVQDNDGPGKGGPEAQASYERLIKAIEAAGGLTYRYVNIDPKMNADGGQPDANIRVGFLYNPDRVKFDNQIKPGDADTAVAYRNNQLTHNPGRISPQDPAFKEVRKSLAAQFEFKGQQVIAIANHWKSKRGDDGLFGRQQPVNVRTEPQRVEIAKRVGAFVSQVQQQNPQAHVISVGDYNDFQWTPSLKTFESYGLKNMVNTVPKKTRYSYVYQGNTQTLDHVLVSKHLAPQTRLDMIHVNSDFTEMAGRASDHDPLLAQIDFSKYIKKQHKK
ncbi:endonuclease/exonuclease/phosphatase family protein [Staphylococcus schleiferi]|uniref:endonuclease/exonuclease/phosphatase family protein n=1 Tax=Staphylococcus schleiferi TaxID=1295 RepID=UPI00188726B3|nr:endonuclease/exonuclease/phosphatase family protein [Staphylococcus schleiferi]MBF1994012.1 endonuclease/exonuclease/phosphatase family protein [Staphylococcus schleiferi]MBF2039621.1 endonuclease/exonuclease/phosphatase family protein [Staphylococcus schleiferi]MBF2101574.1 endonuclease/exonuclease/phosphatase family protein [Staphylococcus schleiferi]MBF2103717.1 endonuclease/exonuclease/phosphatase family protein [Staphylococcus schleiferi]MBF2105870.1 endonuclease/exonuclease/phosphatas